MMQLVLTLLAGLMLKLLEHNTKENINIEEQENLSILLIAINSIIFFASAYVGFLATPYGKKQFDKQYCHYFLEKNNVFQLVILNKKNINNFAVKKMNRLI